MSSGRLLKILTILQARGLVTAQTLAGECEVSVRTIYRDIDALITAGIPVYSERGSEGGYRLLDGYTTRLNGVSLLEAQALFLLQLAGPVADLGLGAAMAAARDKLLGALPEHMRADAEQLRSRFHIDLSTWFTEHEQSEHLAKIAEAVWAQKQLRFRYQSWRSERDREVQPLGIVLKSGTWYLVARSEKEIRAFRVSRISPPIVLGETFERPSDFDLSDRWCNLTTEIQSHLYAETATVKLSMHGMERLEKLSSLYVRRRIEVLAKPGRDGWQTVRIPIKDGILDLLPLAGEIEIIEPSQLRDEMMQIGDSILKAHGDIRR